MCALNCRQLIQSVEISTIAHATDDLDKVQYALRSILPVALRDREVFTRRYMQGHHGNPIVTFDARLTRPSEVEEFIQHFMSLLPKTDKLRITRDIDLHADSDGNLYVRVDKQEAFRGIIQLGDEDPIRVRMKFSRLSGDPREHMRQLLEED